MTRVLRSSGRVEVRGPKEGHCNICDAYGLLTVDHVPPKGTLGIPQVDLIHITEMLSIERPTKAGKRRYMQSGVHFRSLCAPCNNTLLGAKFDPALISFTNSVSTFLRSSLALPEIVSVPIVPGLVARAVLGHLFAVGIERRERTPILDAAVRFFLNDSEPLPDGIDIYYWVHPHKHQVQIRDAGLLTHFGEGTKPIVFWCLKYFPLGFMVTWNIDDRRRIRTQNLRDYMINAGGHEAQVLLPLRALPHAHWPEAPTEHGAVLYGDAAVGALPRE